MNASPLTISDADVRALAASIETALGAEWTDYPGGWPGEIEAGLVHAVLSIRARYGTPTTGVRAAVGRWRHVRQPAHLNDVRALASQPTEGFADVLDNHQRLSGGKLKSSGIVEAATNHARRRL